MADGTGPGRITLNGIAFGVLMFTFDPLASFYFFIGKPYWFPPNGFRHMADQ